jgi:hypothetical protein
MRLTFDQLLEVRDGADLLIDGDVYTLYEELEEEMDENGRNVSYIYIRNSDHKYFMVTLTWVRYGYESYSFEEFDNNGDFYEVRKFPITTFEWRTV